MSLQYRLLFPCGEDKYKPGILKTQRDPQKKIKRANITMRKYYKLL